MTHSFSTVIVNRVLAYYIGGFVFAFESTFSIITKLESVQVRSYVQLKSYIAKDRDKTFHYGCAIESPKKNEKII